MINCGQLIHPFQNDPGVSQRQRVMNELLAGAPPIDGRTLADLLDQFRRLAPGINYYDANLQLSDWTPFFRDSLPFLLAAIVREKTTVMEDKFRSYDRLIRKSPSPDGLQLNLFYVYYHIFRKVNNWHTRLKDSGLPTELLLAKLIKNRLRSALLLFVPIANAASRYYCIRKIDFTSIVENEAWGLQQSDLLKVDTDFLQLNTERGQLLALQHTLAGLFPSLLEGLKALPMSAEKDLPASLTPPDDDLQKKHAPHLALIFVFLRMFQQLQQDLNGFTRKHLDFFYQQVLQLRPQDAVPDKANIVLQLQNQVDQYLLGKGLLVKDGKDNNKAEVLFSLDDDIVVNRTQVSDIRTLFLDNRTVYEQTYIAGVYMAPNATLADGVSQPFKGDPSSYPTLGAENSKYMAPGTNFYQPYPDARLGLVLASPVLLLNEGLRTVTITLNCRLKDNCAAGPSATPPPPDPCCPGGAGNGADPETFPAFIPTDKLYGPVRDALAGTFIYITENLIQAAGRKGITQDIMKAIRSNYLVDCKTSVCCTQEVFYKQQTMVAIPDTFWPDYNLNKAAGQFWTDYFWKGITTDLGTQKILSATFPARKGFLVQFSGEKTWLAPAFDQNINDLTFVMDPALSSTGTFTFTVTATIRPDQPAITFYNAQTLLEDLNTTLPLVKLQLDDGVKVPLDPTLQGILGLPDTASDCCLDRPADLACKEISLYNFFRNVVIDDTTIDVQVCGMKQFIVQNDESVQDVNGLVYAFGTRPRLDSNFYIGSEEIFMKQWSEVRVNVNWKDLPADFDQYYQGYQMQYLDGAIWKNIGEIKKENFLVEFSFLQDGNWYFKPDTQPCSIDGKSYSQLFPALPALPADLGTCFTALADFTMLYSHQYEVQNTDFQDTGGQPMPSPALENYVFKGIKQLDASTRACFLRMSLKCQDFQHEQYPFVLARQMAAAGKLPDLVAGAVYFGIDPVTGYEVLDLSKLFNDVINSANISDQTLPTVEDVWNKIHEALGVPPDNFPDNLAKVTAVAFSIEQPISVNFVPPPVQNYASLKDAEEHLNSLLDDMRSRVQNFTNSGAVIPKEPYTPVISGMSLDYQAGAKAADITLIHLYPYTGTYKQVELRLNPPLLPTFCDEGNLFLGLKDLVPGENLNLLFQLAEATSDSETDPQDVYWYYLVNNGWQPLRNKFEVLDDTTDNLTTSGIVKFSLPANIAADNTIMPKGLYWLRAGVSMNSVGVSESLAILPQAISVTFTNDPANDKLRLANPLPAGSISKLETADANIKSVNQPYDGFGGAVPELQSQYYVRVSELLRHKGRAIQKFDYERLVLQNFPQLFKAKCVNHSFSLNAHLYMNDFPFSPGYVQVAVIPDLNKLKAANSFQPRTPVSLLEQIEKFLQGRSSPFVRIRAMNPRYEAVHFCITVKLLAGKDPTFFKNQLAADIREFMAPWVVGDYYKLSFGQCVSRSDILQFLETRDYIDYILKLQMIRDDDKSDPCKEPMEICPATPRSILIAGDVEVCVMPNDSCEQWGEGDCNDAVQLNDYCK